MSDMTCNHPSRDPYEGRIRALLEGFAQARIVAEASEKTQANADHERISALLGSFKAAEDRYRRQQEEFADDFNLFAVMQLTGKEIRHSMVLAWLLDRDIRKLGTHGQGNLGFRLFLEQFHLPPYYAECKYWVRREVRGDESIVDVEVAARGQFLIHIENKIWSGEGTVQTDREWSDLQRRAAELNLSSKNVQGLFLTPSRMKPLNSNFHPISWGDIVGVLERFADQAKPPDVKLFARHYAHVLRRFIVTFDIPEGNHDETTDERG